jgi:hypothetical protein
VSLFHELVLFWESITAYDEKSLTENVLGKIASLPRFLGKNPDPKTALPFLLTVLPLQPEKRAAASPLNCRARIPANQPDGENTHFNAYFLYAWTMFSYCQRTPSSICQKEQFTGLFEIHSCLPPPYNSSNPAKPATPITSTRLHRHTGSRPAHWTVRPGLTYVVTSRALENLPCRYLPA